MLGRYGMLECGQNFKGTHKLNCPDCHTYDNEVHRLNNCVRFRTTNQYDSDTKIDFDQIFSDNIENLREIIPRIFKVWNVRNANGTMVTL